VERGDNAKTDLACCTHHAVVTEDREVEMRDLDMIFADQAAQRPFKDAAANGVADSLTDASRCECIVTDAEIDDSFTDQTGRFAREHTVRGGPKHNARAAPRDQRVRKAFRRDGDAAVSTAIPWSD